MLFSKFCQLRRLIVFDQSSPVHPVLESRVGSTMSVTNGEGIRTAILVSNIGYSSNILD